VFDALLLLITAPWFFGAVFITKVSKGEIQVEHINSAGIKLISYV
jgi:hypothetical protein